MAKTMKTGRKPGTGWNFNYAKKGQLKYNSYKLYYLHTDKDDTPKFILLTTRWISQKVSFYVYISTKQNSKRDRWIRKAVENGETIKSTLLEMMPSGTTDHQAKVRMNEYMDKYKDTITNNNRHTFVNAHLSKNKHIGQEMIDKIISLSDGIKTQSEISKSLKISPCVVRYWQLKYGISKQKQIEKEMEVVRPYILYSTKTIHKLTGLDKRHITYLLTKIRQSE